MPLAAQLIDEFILVGKLTGLVFRINEIAIDVNVEYTPTAFDQNGFSVESVFQFGSQTDRLRFIVSFDAISDRNIHVFAFVDRG
ncbi:MAG: hypothetical protein O7C67_10500 [Gammaproteobacteria bacterium]|nr:hypothetical protein [Gammaproteobacteria bacterium]